MHCTSGQRTLYDLQPLCEDETPEIEHHHFPPHLDSVGAGSEPLWLTPQRRPDLREEGRERIFNQLPPLRAKLGSEPATFRCTDDDGAVSAFKEQYSSEACSVAQHYVCKILPSYSCSSSSSLLCCLPLYELAHLAGNGYLSCFQVLLSQGVLLWTHLGHICMYFFKVNFPGSGIDGSQGRHWLRSAKLSSMVFVPNYTSPSTFPLLHVPANCWHFKLPNFFPNPVLVMVFHMVFISKEHFFEVECDFLCLLENKITESVIAHSCFCSFSIGPLHFMYLFKYLYWFVLIF